MQSTLSTGEYAQFEWPCIVCTYIYMNVYENS